MHLNVPATLFGVWSQTSNTVHYLISGAVLCQQSVALGVMDVNRAEAWPCARTRAGVSNTRGSVSHNHGNVFNTRGSVSNARVSGQNWFEWVQPWRRRLSDVHTPARTGSSAENGVVVPTVLPTAGLRDSRPGFFVGAPRPTVGNTVDITTPLSARYPMSSAELVLLY